MSGLGERIKQLREEKGFSQQQLAEMMNLKRPIISQIENNQRNVKAEELKLLSEIFDVPADIILQGKTKKNRKIPAYDKKKFQQLLLYITQQCAGKPNVGKTVLYKLLYFCEFNFYEKYKKPLTGATFIKLPMGPAPALLDKVVEEMTHRQEIVSFTTQYFHKYQQRLIPNKKPDMSVFSVEEKHIIDEVIFTLSDMSASEISEYSHGDAPRKETEDMEIISYDLVEKRDTDYSILAQEKQLQDSISQLKSTNAFDYLLDDPDLYDEYKI